MSSKRQSLYHRLVRDPRVLVRVLTPLLIAALLVGALLEYRRSAREQERLFGEKQIFLAAKGANHLTEVFRQVHRFMTLLGQLEQVRTGSVAGERVLEAVVTMLRDQGAIAAGILDVQGQEILTTTRSAGALAQLTRSPSCQQAQMCVRGPVRWKAAPSGWTMVVTTEASRRPSLKPGWIVLLLDWGRMQRQIAQITRLTEGTYSWVLDQSGRLIMHPEHRDQLGHGAMEPEKSCDRCHTSYAVQRRMTRGEQGTGKIQVAGREPKLVAFTPFKVGLARWSLAVSSPAQLTTLGSRRSLLSISLFTGAIMMVMIVGALLLDRESSRRIRAAAAFNRDLEAQVEQRTAEIRALYERLTLLRSQHEQLERTAVAGEMAAIVAHEVRTPLNALSINAQRITRLLRRGDDQREKVLEVVATLDEEIQRINLLLEEHLLAQVRQKKLEIEPICLNELVQDSIRFMEPEANRQGVELRSALESRLPPVRADAAKLRQVLLNIVLNAIQALKDGGAVEVHTQQRRDRAQIVVQDNGPGFAESLRDDPEQIFRPFVTTKEDGTGLGLAICARLIRAMDGVITVRSERGEGACFTIALPIDEERERCL